MEMEKFYVAPEVEVLEVAVERGFGASIEDDVPAGGQNPM